MFKKIMFIALIIILSALAILSVHAWNNARDNQTKEVERAQAVEAERAAAEQSELERIKMTCREMITLYEGMDEDMRQEVTPPNCELDQI